MRVENKRRSPRHRVCKMWTPERVDELKRLHAQDKSAREIGALMGGFEHTPDNGRSAVLGKIFRLKLAPNNSREETDRKRRTAPVKKPTPWRTRFGAGKVLPPKPAEVRPKLLSEADLTGFQSTPDLVVPEAKRVRSIVDLAPEQCRWPFGDPRAADFHFCHHTKVEGQPYCEFHCRRAFNAVPVRRRHVPEIVAPKKETETV